MRLNAQSVCPPQHWALSQRGRRKNGSTGPPQCDPSDSLGDQDAEYAQDVQVSRRGHAGAGPLLVGRGALIARCPQRGQTTSMSSAASSYKLTNGSRKRPGPSPCRSSTTHTLPHIAWPATPHFTLVLE